ncbi:MAG: ribokinase, partial [Clostridiales bacterium]|nr:ribokinase [Clostridiales bacterium]
MKKIIVIGSLNMDLVTRVKLTPKIGETVLGNGLEKIPGGKGANQAVAIGRLKG